jgi:hypothetical protein
MHVTCRQLFGAWLEWRKVSQAYGAAGMASSLSCGKLGPACLCPACAAVPADPEEEEPTTTGVCAWRNQGKVVAASARVGLWFATVLRA